MVVFLLCWGRCLTTVRHRPFFVAKKPPRGCRGQNRGQKPGECLEIKDSAIAYGPKGREFESSTARQMRKPRKACIYKPFGVFLFLLGNGIPSEKQYKTIQNCTFPGGKTGGKIMPDPSVLPQASGCRHRYGHRCWRSFLCPHDPSSPLLYARPHLSF